MGGTETDVIECPCLSWKLHSPPCCHEYCVLVVTVVLCYSVLLCCGQCHGLNALAIMLDSSHCNLLLVIYLFFSFVSLVSWRLITAILLSLSYTPGAYQKISWSSLHYAYKVC
jgi:hypothetical protein